MKVGLDFGTTNTVISYWDDNERPENSLKQFSYNEKITIPTALRYNDIKDIEIGHIAISNSLFFGGSNPPLRQFFKTSLGTAGRSGGDALQWTEDFLRYLFIGGGKSFSKEVGSSIDKLVISVPEAWQKSLNPVAVDALTNTLKKILKDLDTTNSLPIIQSVSEPVAALAYYLYDKKNKPKQDKSSEYEVNEDKTKYIYVCDMGGGTGDVSFCEVKGSVINIIAHDGNINKAGVYDKKEILSKVYSTAKKIINEADLSFQQHLYVLSENIHDKSFDDVGVAYGDYLKSNKSETFKVSINGTLFADSKHIFEEFTSINNEIHNVLSNVEKKVKSYFQGKKINSHYDCILLTGGFSKYYPIQHSIANFFKIALDDPKIEVFNQQTRVCAVAKGCALIASDQIQIYESYPCIIGIVTFDEYEQRQDIMISSEDYLHLNDVNHIKWHDGKFLIRKNELKITGYVAFHEDAHTKQSFDDMLQINNTNLLNSECRMGIEVNRAGGIFIHLRRQDDERVGEKLPLETATQIAMDKIR